jgi:hypothetical protein
LTVERLPVRGGTRPEELAGKIIKCAGGKASGAFQGETKDAAQEFMEKTL